MKSISLIVYDFDGVLTDNRVWVSQDGTESVSCNRSDGWWIARIKELGVPQIILSTEKNPVVSARGSKLGLEVVQGQSDKKAALLDIVKRAGHDLSSVCYVGNDMNDFECMKIVGLSIAPRDSHSDILKIAKFVAPTDGGDGVVRHVYDLIQNKGGQVLSQTNRQMSLNSRETISAIIETSIQTKTAILKSESLLKLIERMGDAVVSTLKSGNKIFFAGNGGSFSDSIHLAAEFVSRLNFDRAPLASIALGANQSNLTAIGNDYGYEHVFEREILALGQKGDLLIAISTSGNSPSIINAVKAAKERGVAVFGWSGESGGKLAELCETFKVPAKNTARIQECHIMVGHSICEMAENAIFGSARS